MPGVTVARETLTPVQLRSSIFELRIRIGSAGGAALAAIIPAKPGWTSILNRSISSVHGVATNANRRKTLKITRPLSIMYAISANVLSRPNPIWIQ